jgi:hypothetical protein
LLGLLLLMLHDIVHVECDFSSGCAEFLTNLNDGVYQGVAEKRTQVVEELKE